MAPMFSRMVGCVVMGGSEHAEVLCLKMLALAFQGRRNSGRCPESILAVANQHTS